MYKNVLTQDYSYSVLTLKALAALSQPLNKTHPRAEMHLGCLGLSDEQQRIQLQYSPFSQEQSFILCTEALKRGYFTMSGMTFNWRNNKRLIVVPLLEITTAILPPTKQINVLFLQCNYACRVTVMTE